MYDRVREPDGGKPVSAAELYALLRQLTADLRRLEALVRSMKKTMEEKKKDE